MEYPSIAPSIPLAGGTSIPAVGLGVFRSAWARRRSRQSHGRWRPATGILTQREAMETKTAWAGPSPAAACPGRSSF